jgi:hypothetical protein
MPIPRKVKSYAPSAPEPVTPPHCRYCRVRMDLTRISPDVGGGRYQVLRLSQLSSDELREGMI